MEHTPRGRLAIAFDVVGAVLAWLVIAAVAAFLVWRNSERSAEAPAENPAWLVGVETQGRYLVGAAHLLDSVAQGNAAPNKGQLVTSARALDKGPYSQRLRAAVLVGDLAGPQAAREALAALEDDRQAGKVEARAVSVRAAELLDRLYAEYELDFFDPAGALDEAERQTLRSGLGWFGELALAPEDGDEADRAAAMRPALWAAYAVFALTAGMIVGPVLGLAVIALVFVQALRGKLSGLSTGATRGGVYVETFALYALIYLGLGYLMTLTDLGRSQMLGSLGAMFLSLAALAWPVLRGVPWRRVREDVGLSFAARPVWGTALGPATYLAALPMLAASVLLMFLLMKLMKMDSSQPGSGPSHPIVAVAVKKDWWLWAQVFLVAVVGAPVVEEIMFRGVLYRHVRELTGGWMWKALSVAASVAVTGFVFAVIHPQGWLGVPVLMSLATAFAVSREAQHSLWPPVLAHGLNNGVSLLILWATAG